jgi:GDP-4-dehydro-6-deoxy-D-mannose reductase
VEIERGRRPAVLETGNLTPRRDLTDVRDIVRGYLLLLERGRSGEAYNLGVGEAPSMREVIERLMALSGIRSEIRSRGELRREVETAVLRADSSMAQRETGWSPKFSLEQTLGDILDYWRSQELPESLKL